MTSAEQKPLAIGIGEILWDLLPGGKQLGGAVANFAYHARSLGMDACVVSAVGDDTLGRDILARLSAHSLDPSTIAIDPAHPTGTVTVRLDAAGQPTYTIHENVAWDFIPWHPSLADLAARADAVCFGSLAQRSPASRATIRRFLSATRPDCLRAFDVNLRQTYFNRQILHESLEICNVLKLSESEFPVACDLLNIPGPEDEMLASLIDRYQLDLVALTCGERGGVLKSRSTTVEFPAAPVDQIVDTVGAGDSFTAALVWGLLRGDPLDRIAARAARLSGFVCSRAGGMPAIPQDLLPIMAD